MAASAMPMIAPPDADSIVGLASLRFHETHGESTVAPANVLFALHCLRAASSSFRCPRAGVVLFGVSRSGSVPSDYPRTGSVARFLGRWPVRVS